MNPEDVGKILDQITDRLAPASQAAWDIMVTEVIISSAFALTGAVLIAVGIIIGLIYVWKITAEAMASTYGKVDAQAGRGAAVGVAVLFGIPAVVALAWNGVIGLVIPEFHLLNRFLNILTGGGA